MPPEGACCSILGTHNGSGPWVCAFFHNVLRRDANRTAATGQLNRGVLNPSPQFCHPRPTCTERAAATASSDNAAHLPHTRYLPSEPSGRAGSPRRFPLLGRIIPLPAPTATRIPRIETGNPPYLGLGTLQQPPLAIRTA